MFIIIKIVWTKSKLSSCLDKPWEFQQFEAPRIFRQTTHEGSKFVSLRHRPPVPPRIFLVLIYVGVGVDPRPIVRPEELRQRKIPVTPSVIEPTTFWLAAQFTTACPPIIVTAVQNRVWLAEGAHRDPDWRFLIIAPVTRIHIFHKSFFCF